MTGSENPNFSMYASYSSIQKSHTSHISNSPGSNKQDDESDCKGSLGSIEGVSPESATRNRSGSARFGTAGEQALSEAAGGSMAVVPCAPLMSQNQGSQRDSQGDSQGAQSTSSAAEPSGEDGLQLSSTGNTLEGEPGRTMLTTRSGREIRKPFRLRDSSFRSIGDVSSNQAR